jgi:phosphoadenosine phosphosulfate reductase
MTTGTLMPSAALARARSAAIGHLEPEKVLAWALATAPGRAALTVSFGGAGVALAHMVSRIDRRTPVLFLDTGMLFEATYRFKNEFSARYRLNVIDVRPDHDPGPLYQTDPDRCCAIRKVEPMTRAIKPYDTWISALRRDQGGMRKSIDVVEYHEIDDRPILKVFPLAHWTRADVWRYIRRHGIPYHPMLDQGYSSLGCWPCTTPSHTGESERAGRWRNSGKTECGLHFRLPPPDQSA